MKMLQKIIAPVLCCALALSLAGCRASTPATVLTVDDTEISAGLYLLYQLQAYSSAKNLQTDTKVDVLKDTLEDKTGADWVSDETHRLARRYVAIEQQFASEGLSLTEDELATAKKSAQSAYAESEKTYSANGVGEQSFTAYYVNEVKYDKLVSADHEKNAAAVSDKDAKAYMDAQYNRVSTLMLPITKDDGSQISEEEIAKVQAIADKLEKDLSAGGDMEKLAPAALKETFQLCGLADSEDALAQYQYTTFVQQDSGYFDAETTAAIFAAQAGDAGQAPVGTVPMVYQKLPNYEDDKDFKANYRDAIVRSICLEQFDEALKTAGEALEVTGDANAVQTYSPKNIKLG